MVVNGPKHPGAVGLPPLNVKPFIPPVPQKKKEFAGWRPFLLEHGPKEFAKAVRAHQGLLLTDTTWRDAHQSLLATRVRTIDMDNVADYTAYAMNEVCPLPKHCHLRVV
jgi:pyruvate carboxylase